MTSGTSRQSKEAFEMLEKVRARVRLTAETVLVKGPRLCFEKWAEDLRRELTLDVHPFPRECCERVLSAIEILLHPSRPAN